MTTIPSTSAAAAQTAVTVSGGRAVPVGLFGEASSTTLGLVLRSPRGHGRRRAEVLLAAADTQSVIASRAYSGYIEYVGAKDTAVRPGPPKACRICSMISLEPLAAHTCAGVRPWPR